MDFDVPRETEHLLQQVRSFLEHEAYPLEPRFLQGGFGAVEADLNRLRHRVRELGLWLPQVPQAYGGLGLRLFEHGLVAAELGRSPFGHYLFNCQAPDAGNMEILLEHGTPDQRSRFLEPLLEGGIRSCFSMTEPQHAGSNPALMSTTAVRDGDAYVVDGRKWFSTGGDGAAFAVVVAMTDPDAAPHERASLFLVPMDLSGVHVERSIPIMGRCEEGWLSHVEIRFDECRVPEANVVGAPGAGFGIAEECLAPGRVLQCMRRIGVCERCLELMCDHALERETAPGDPLATKQLVQSWIARSRAEIDAARLLALRAAWRIERDGLPAAREDLSVIKFHTSGVVTRVVDRALQTHGGLGVTDYTPLAYFYRTERAGRISDGPDEVHEIVVGNRILKRRAGRSEHP